MINYESIQKAMQVEIAISKKMANHIYLWSKLYTNEAPWLKEDVKSLNIASAISAEISRLTTMEMEYSISGKGMADYLSKQFKKVYSDLPKCVEYACSTGGFVFKPYIDGLDIAVDYVQAGNFYPTAFNSAGKITGCIFPEFKQIGKKLYTRLEHQFLKGNTYVIQNKAFVSEDASVKVNGIVNLGSEISLSEIDEWSSLISYDEFERVEGTLFAYFKPSLANNIDMSSPLGVSVYSRAVNLIQDAEEQYSATLWEYRSKETAIQAGDEFFQKNRAGEIVLPRGKEKIYHALGDVQNKDGSPFFNAYSPDIRDESFFNAYNRIVQKIEFNVGLAYGTLSDPQVVDKTAEEIKSSKQRSYVTVKALQNNLEATLNDLVQAMSVWAKIGGLVKDENYETGYKWDDSIVADKEKDRLQDRQDVAMGVMQLWEYRAKWYGESEEVAKSMIPDQADTEDSRGVM